MIGSVASFGQIAKGMSRNPLGIVALFIVLIYGMAAMAFSFSQHLCHDERILFIGFLCLYPFAVLGAFCWLVAKHHTKLYSPGDYRFEGHFFGPQSLPHRLEREQEEANQIEKELDAPPASGAPKAAQSVPAESSLSRKERLVKVYREAEDLAIRELEAQIGVPAMRNIAFSDRGSALGFDAAFVGLNLISVVEVKVIGSRPSDQLVEAVFAQARQARETVKRNEPSVQFAFVLALVLLENADVDEAFLQSLFFKKGKQHDFMLDVRVMSLAVLRRRFSGDKRQ